MPKVCGAAPIPICSYELSPPTPGDWELVAQTSSLELSVLVRGIDVRGEEKSEVSTGRSHGPSDPLTLISVGGLLELKAMHLVLCGVSDVWA
ncbi:hypothetical protein KC323_g320 [Hortaea werneckii]|nr:hypothetical protein KC323_g320 [Hortaea werneckii]